MNDKEIVSESKITSDIISKFLILGIIGLIIYGRFIKVLDGIDSLFILAIITILLQGLLVYFIWKFSILLSFKKKTIYTIYVPTVMSKLKMFTVALWIMSLLSNFSQVNTKIEEIKNSYIYSYQYYMSKIEESVYSNNGILDFKNLKTKEEYDKEYNKEIDKQSSKLYNYMVLLQIGLLIVYFIALTMQKKNILKYTIEN